MSNFSNIQEMEATLSGFLLKSKDYLIDLKPLDKSHKDREESNMEDNGEIS